MRRIPSVLEHLRKIGRGLWSVGSDVAESFSERAFDTLVATPGWLDRLLAAAALRMTPIEVEVLCRPTGSLPDAYAVEIDVAAFDQAVEAGRMVRPQIIIRARSDQLDRTLLADRLIKAFTGTFAKREAAITDAKREEMKERARNSWLMADIGIDVALASLALCLIGAGAVVGPFLMLLIGLGGIAALLQVPKLLAAGIKRVWFGADITRMEDELGRARVIVGRMVEEMTIIVDPDLKESE